MPVLMKTSEHMTDAGCGSFSSVLFIAFGSAPATVGQGVLARVSYARVSVAPIFYLLVHALKQIFRIFWPPDVVY